MFHDNSEVGIMSSSTTVTGNSGNNTIVTGNGNDTINGGAGNDVILSGNGNDYVEGGSGNDIISSGNGKDYVLGGSGNDLILTGNGNDIADGGSGSDTVYLGNGNDTLIYNADENLNSCDFACGGSGYDTLVFNISQSLMNSLNITVETLENIFNYNHCWWNDVANFSTIGLNFWAYNFEDIVINVIIDNTPPVAQDDVISVSDSLSVTGNLYANNGNGVDSDPDGDTLTVTQINGVAYTAGTQITLASGNLLTVQANGDFSYQLSSPDLPVFTGDASVDFNGLSNVVTILDGFDVGVPPAFPFISGWDINAVKMVYDYTTDTLYVGIDTIGILGDADGDGDPSVTSSALSSRGGIDLPNLQGSEFFHFMIDTSQDNVFNPEYVVGVSSVQDISTFGIYEYAGNPFDPTYGASVSSSQVNLHANPSALAPDLEFSISNFFSTLGTNPFDGFGLRVSTGSFVDDGIGEDSLPDLGPTLAVKVIQNVNDSFTYTVDDGNGATDTALVNINIMAA